MKYCVLTIPICITISYSRYVHLYILHLIMISDKNASYSEKMFKYLWLLRRKNFPLQ